MRPQAWAAVLLVGLWGPWGWSAGVQVSPRVWTAVVVHVSDGDTIHVRSPGEDRSSPVRLLGLDAPEICQAFGVQAREALQARVLHRQVSLRGVGHDVYGRELAQVFLQGEDMGRALVAQGWAWSYRHGSDPGPYAREQRQARSQRLGLFVSGDRPEPPWAFRRRHGTCH